jgi:hypothetical protein
MAAETKQHWLVQSLGGLPTLITICVLVGGWVVYFATERAELSDHERRISVIESEIVPRREHEAAAKIEEQKERLLDERLTNIERMLQEQLSYQRQR